MSYPSVTHGRFQFLPLSCYSNTALTSLTRNIPHAKYIFTEIDNHLISSICVYSNIDKPHWLSKKFIHLFDPCCLFYCNLNFAAFPLEASLLYFATSTLQQNPGIAYCSVSFTLSCRLCSLKNILDPLVLNDLCKYIQK